MTTLQAKPIINEKFWIVEQDGKRFATLRKDEARFVLSSTGGVQVFESKEKLIKQFGPNFFVVNVADTSVSTEKLNEVHGFPTRTEPFNAMFDIRNRLPLYVKSEVSSCIHAAGYYIIEFEKGWCRAFCPKLITLQRNNYQGPFKTEIEMKQVLRNVQK